MYQIISLFGKPSSFSMIACCWCNFAMTSLCSKDANRKSFQRIWLLERKYLMNLKEYNLFYAYLEHCNMDSHICYNNFMRCSTFGKVKNFLFLRIYHPAIYLMVWGSDAICYTSTVVNIHLKFGTSCYKTEQM